MSDEQIQEAPAEEPVNKDAEMNDLQLAQVRALTGMGFSHEQAEEQVQEFTFFLGRIVELFEASKPSASKIAALMLFADRLQLNNLSGKDARVCHELFTQAQRFMQARRARKGVV